MPTPISPGVYSKINDLSEYVGGVPGTIGFLPIFADKGPDNELMFISSKDFLIKYFGETPYKNFGTKYGMGHEIAKQFLTQSSSAYVMRMLPKDATYSNLVFDISNSELDPEDPYGRLFTYRKQKDEKYVAKFSGISGFTGLSLKSLVRETDVDNVTNASGHTFEDHERPLLMFYPTGRGEFYNNWSISFTKTHNPNVLTYTLYELVDGEHKVLEMFDVSFDPDAKDYGESIFIVDILNVYSEYLRAEYNYEVSEEEQMRAFLKFIDQEDILAEAVPEENEVMVVDGLVVESNIQDVNYTLATLTQGFGTDPNEKKLYYIDLDNTGAADLDTFKLMITNNIENAGTWLDETCKTEVGTNLTDLVRGDVLKIILLDDTDGNKTFRYEIVDCFTAVEQYRVIRLRTELANEKQGYYELSGNGTAIPGIPTVKVFADGTYEGPKVTEVDKIISNYSDIEFNLIGTNDEDGNEITELVYFIDDCADGDIWAENVDFGISYIYQGTVLTVTKDDTGEFKFEPGNVANTNIVYDHSTNNYNEVDTCTGIYSEVNYIHYIATSLVNTYNGQRIPLTNGSSGKLKNSMGTVIGDEANILLIKALKAELDKKVYDTDGTYFTVMFDAGYDKVVKDAMVNLALTRQDCMTFMDIGNNTTANKAVLMRKSKYNYNTYFAAMYANYCKVYLEDINKYQWVTPIYEIARIIPYNDFTAELWDAPAGFNRAIINDVHELRYYPMPKSGDMDQLYLNQLNPVVKFEAGYTVWGQLTAQRKNSKLSDIHAVRTLLYIKRALEQFCKFYIFERNDAATHQRIAKNINLFLSDVKRRGGLKGFSVSVGASEYQLKRKTVQVDVNLEFPDIIEIMLLNFNVVG